MRTQTKLLAGAFASLVLITVLVVLFTDPSMLGIVAAGSIASFLTVAVPLLLLGLLVWIVSFLVRQVRLKS